MRHSLLAAVTAALLTLPLAPAAVAADPGDKADPELPGTASDTAREHAEDALDQAQALLTDEHGGGSAKPPAGPESAGDATMALLQLMRVRDDLATKDRQRASRLFARPTDGVDDPYDDGYDQSEETPVCGDHVCVHWVATGEDAPVDADGDGQLVDTVQQVLQVAEHVHRTYLSSGYRHPDFDGTTGGGSNTFDIYLADLGTGAYGYTAPEPYGDETAPYDRQGFIVIDNDFAGFPNTWLENVQVTVAHEYFHLVQFGYDAFEDPWFMEATATWAEDEVYDGVNDNRQYLPAGQLRKPAIPLDQFTGSSAAPYGQWIFFRYLTERWSGTHGSLPRIVLQMWRRVSARAGATDDYSTQAIHSVLARRHKDFARVYQQFAAANRTPRRSYEEGHAGAYRAAPADDHFRLGKGHRATGRHHTLDMDHLTSYSVRLHPRHNLRRRDWTVRVRVNMPHRRTAPSAGLVIKRQHGRVLHRTIRLNRKGIGKRAVAFGSRRVRYVEVVLANASRRTRFCYEYTAEPVYACYGSPRDDYKRSRFAARIYRR